MKFRHEIVIEADRDTVWRLFDDADNMKKWQPTLESFTPTSGEPGQPGATAELVYDEGGRKVTLVETVTERREPHFLAGRYESAMGKAVIVNRFEETEDELTHWSMYANHNFRGVFRLLGLFFVTSIRIRNEELMNNFKRFAETGQAEHTQ